MPWITGAMALTLSTPLLDGKIFDLWKSKSKRWLRVRKIITSPCMLLSHLTEGSIKQIRKHAVSLAALDWYSRTIERQLFI